MIQHKRLFPVLGHLFIYFGLGKNPEMMHSLKI